MDINKYYGYLMSKDTILAKIEAGLVTEIYHAELLPLYILRTKNLEGWLKKRAIDNHRTNSRLLKKALRLAERDDVSTVLSVNAVTITDTYWVKEEGSELTWEMVQFKDDVFANLALKGDLSALSILPSRSPEATNIGSFEKCWKLENGTWWLHKRANKYELFSELFIYHLGKELGFPMAHYEQTEDGIRTIDFTKHASVNYEAAFGWMGEEEDYISNYDWLNERSADLADRYVELLILDAICRNGDRHTSNYGILRNVDTGEILGMAPNFDNNIALIYNGDISTPRKSDLLGTLLNELEEERGALTQYLSRNKKPVISDEIIDVCIDKTQMEIDREYMKEFVRVGYEQISWDGT